MNEKIIKHFEMFVDEINNMDYEEFNKFIKKHKNGKYAQMLRYARAEFKLNQGSKDDKNNL